MWTQTGHLTVAIAIIATIAIPSFHIKYSTSDKTCQQVGRPILSNICTLGGGESFFVQISDIYVNWSWTENWGTTLFDEVDRVRNLLLDILSTR